VEEKPFNSYAHTVVNDAMGSGVKYHTYNDIGKFTIFPTHASKRMFPSIFFGRYKKDDYDRCGALGL
jgi:hypothetical protein